MQKSFHKKVITVLGKEKKVYLGMRNMVHVCFHICDSQHGAGSLFCRSQIERSFAFLLLQFCEKSFVQMCHLQQHERSSNHSSTSQFLLSVAAASQVVVDNSSNYNSSTANTIANTNTNSNNLISNQNQPEATASVNGNTNTFSNQV